MKAFIINDHSDFHALCEKISPHKGGENIMAFKSCLKYIYIKDLSSPAANILKQDALSVGAELVCHKDVIIKNIKSEALLMATPAQLKRLVVKEAKQDFGLKDLAKFLDLSYFKPKKPKIMSIININEDSFYENSRVKEDELLKTLQKHVDLGADFIDLGAVSSRPGSVYVGREEELKRLDFAFKIIAKHKINEKVILSLDSFDSVAIKRALDVGFGLINDISGLKNKELLSLAKEYSVPYLLMHMQNEPHNMQDDPHYEDVLAEITDFFAKGIKECEEAGVKDVLIDPGFGFGKRLEDNLIIIKHLEHFLTLKKPILVGASRKGSINKIYTSKVSERLPGTLALHARAAANGASVIRCHDLSEHLQYFAIIDALNNTNAW